MCYIALDNFLNIMDNKRKETQISELEAWLYFIGSDKVEHIYKVIESYPWFAELYKEINEFRHHPEEAIKMFSDALRIMDRNTVWYMIDEEKQARETAEKRAGAAEKRADTAEQERDEEKRRARTAEQERDEEKRRAKTAEQKMSKQQHEIEKLKAVIDRLQKK